jgi:hypothetical protein
MRPALLGSLYVPVFGNKPTILQLVVWFEMRRATSPLRMRLATRTNSDQNRQYHSGWSGCGSEGSQPQRGVRVKPCNLLRLLARTRFGLRLETLAMARSGSSLIVVGFLNVVVLWSFLERAAAFWLSPSKGRTHDIVLGVWVGLRTCSPSKLLPWRGQWGVGLCVETRVVSDAQNCHHGCSRPYHSRWSTPGNSWSTHFLQCVHPLAAGYGLAGSPTRANGMGGAGQLVDIPISTCFGSILSTSPALSNRRPWDGRPVCHSGVLPTVCCIVVCNVLSVLRFLRLVYVTRWLYCLVWNWVLCNGFGVGSAFAPAPFRLQSQPRPSAAWGVYIGLSVSAPPPWWPPCMSPAPAVSCGLVHKVVRHFACGGSWYVGSLATVLQPAAAPLVQLGISSQRTLVCYACGLGGLGATRPCCRGRLQ